jgi:hypothetical protein
MTFYERVGNLHIHSTASDGTATHEELAALANKAGLDFLIVTDHNVYCGERQGWYGRTLLLVGEEVHDPTRPPSNHCLVFGLSESVAEYGDDPQRLVEAVRVRGGLGFVAHPFEKSGAYASEPEINWTAWHVEGMTGLEIWNYMSEFKSYVVDLPRALLYALWPKLAMRGPYAETLTKWDELLGKRRVYAIGGSDAHAQSYRAGPLKRQVFSYKHLFRAVNTHILVPELWGQDASRDAQLVYTALATGKAFVAYDALAPAWGFQFTLEHRGQSVTMGEECKAEGQVRLHARLPSRAHIRLIHNGFCIAQADGTELTHTTRAPGAYRIEAYRPYAFKQRGWIYSNPIFVKTPTVQAGPTA